MLCRAEDDPASNLEQAPNMNASHFVVAPKYANQPRVDEAWFDEKPDTSAAASADLANDKSTSLGKYTQELPSLRIHTLTRNLPQGTCIKAEYM